MSYKSRSRKLDYPLHGQSLSSQAAENHFQSLRSQVFNKQGGGQQGNSSSNSSSSSGPIRCLAWNGPGSRVACGYYDRSVKVWMPDHPDGHGMTDIKNAHDRPVESISWDPTHADRVVSCASDGTIKAWDARAKTLLAETRNGHDNLVVRFSGDGRFLAVATAKTDLIIIYRVRRPQKESGVTWGIEYLCQFRENEEIYDLQWAENGSDTTYVLASGLGNGNVRIYRFDTIDVNTEKARTNPSSDEDLSEAVNKLANVYTLRGHRTAANCLNFDPKGKYLAVGSNEGIVSLWDLQNFICIKTFFKTE